VIDLWLDDTTLNISQPCLVDVASDVFRVDPGIAKMMLGLSDKPWLACIRRLAMGPFGLGAHYDIISILRILDRTRGLEEIYILLSLEVISAKTCYYDMKAPRSGIGYS
jgi:hypothetical protein